MNAVFNIIRVSIFLILASFASAAWSITVSSEMNGASGTSLDGAWDHGGCTFDDEDEYDGDFYREYLIFQDTFVEARIVQFGIDSSCLGAGTIAESETYTFTDEGNVESLGWEDEPPACVDPTNCSDPNPDLDGLLDPEPLITEIEVFIPGDPDAEDPEDREDGFETIYWYMDDTDQTDLLWYLFFTAEDENEELTRILSSEEPYFKTDIDIGVIPVPAGIWLFGTALIGFVGYSRRRKIG